MGWGDGFASGLRAGTAFGSTLVSTYKAGAKDRAIGEAEDAYKKAIENAQGLEGTAREEAIRTAEANRRDAYLGSNRYSNGMSAAETHQAIGLLDKGPQALNDASMARNRWNTAKEAGAAVGNKFLAGGNNNGMQQEAIPTGTQNPNQGQQAQVTAPSMGFKDQSMGLLSAAMNGDKEAQALLNEATGMYGGGSLSFDNGKIGWTIGNQTAPLDMNRAVQMGNQFFGIGSAYAKFGS